MTTTNPAPAPGSRRLTRTDGPIAGVAGGFAHYLDMDPTLFRLILVVGLFIGGPTVVFTYLLAWIIIPPAESMAGNVPAPPPPSSPPRGAPAPPSPAL